jgi:hypothetical protein
MPERFSSEDINKGGFKKRRRNLQPSRFLYAKCIKIQAQLFEKIKPNNDEPDELMVKANPKKL